MLQFYRYLVFILIILFLNIALTKNVLMLEKGDILFTRFHLPPTFRAPSYSCLVSSSEHIVNYIEPRKV